MAHEPVEAMKERQCSLALDHEDYAARGNTLSRQRGSWHIAGIIKETLSGYVGPGSSANLTGCRADNQTIQTRGVCEREFKFRFGQEGFQGNAIAANRTREIRRSGMGGEFAET